MRIRVLGALVLIVVLCMSVRLAPAQDQKPASSPIELLLALGDPVALTGQLGDFSLTPLNPGPQDSTVRRITSDGSLVVFDPAGAALLLIRGGQSETLLDTTAQDPIDGVHLTRLLQVEAGRDGFSAVVALRGDNRRGIYRLNANLPADDRARLARLALLPKLPDEREFTRSREELAISDGGVITYIASLESGKLALFRSVGDRAVTLAKTGDVLVTGWRVQSFSDLTANDMGDLAVLLRVVQPTTSVVQPDGLSAEVIVRQTKAGPVVMAKSGDQVPGLSGTTLAGLERPRIGPDGSVVFQGTLYRPNSQGKLLYNFFIARPGRPLEVLLPDQEWRPAAATFDYDYDVAENGAVALRAIVRNDRTGADYDPLPALYLGLPTGEVLPVVENREELQPTGRPVFGPGGVLYFQARNPDWPFDENGRTPVGLFRYRLGDRDVTPVAVPGDRIPRTASQQLLSMPQPPVVSSAGVAFAGLFGGSDRFAVPITGLFHMPLEGSIKDGTLIAAEGAGLSASGRIVAFRDFYYTADGKLLFDTLVRKGISVGQMISVLDTPASTASVVRSQAVQNVKLSALLVKGISLGGDRQFVRALGNVAFLPPDRLLFIAEYTQPGGGGVGLFTLDRSKTPQALVLKNYPALGPSLAGAHFVGFGDLARSGNNASASIFQPSVSADGSVVFKALLDQRGDPTFGLFQWLGGDPTALAATRPDTDTLAQSADDHPPYTLLQWQAGVEGHSYFLEQHRARSGTTVARLFEQSATGLRVIAAVGAPLQGEENAPSMTQLSDFVINGNSELFVQGAAGPTGQGIFRVQSGTRAAPMKLDGVVAPGKDLPKRGDGHSYSGWEFGEQFTLRRDSACGDLAFEADVRERRAPQHTARGLFARRQGSIETVLIGDLDYKSKGKVYQTELPPDEPCDWGAGALSVSRDGQQSRGVVAFSIRAADGHWAIYRTRLLRDLNTGAVTASTDLIAEEAPVGWDRLQRFSSLDPSLLLGKPEDSGPVFHVNAAGDVVFLAFDGQRWGIYRFSDRT